MLLALAAALLIPLGLDLYMPVPQDNPLTAEKIETGRRLFNDRRLSRDGSIACSTCHDPARAFSQDRPIPIGVLNRSGRRNAPALINRGYGRAFFWDARVRTLEEQVLRPIADPDEMDLPVDEAAARVNLSVTDVAQSLASYVRAILSGDAPYDRFVNGNSSALTTEQRRGLEVFRGKGNCTACHVGPNFSDERIHNTGIAWRDGRLLDSGAGNGAFKTPTLREVARTSPYMHDGSFATLEDVIDYYDRGGNANAFLDPDIRRLSLNAAEKQALAAFLRALSGHVSQER